MQGFRKVIKKHDKLTSSSLKETYWPLVEERYPDSKKDVLQSVSACVCVCVCVCVCSTLVTSPRPDRCSH